MPDRDFDITFTGPPSRFPPFRQFYLELSAAKRSLSECEMLDEDVEPIVQDAKWIDLLDSETMESLSDPGKWSLEDILECLLRGE